MRPSLPIAWARVRYATLSAALAALLTPLLLPWYHGNNDARTVLVTVFSILAGFLVAVMAIVADDRSLAGRNWREDTFYLQSIRAQLTRHRLLFQLYLVILVLTFVDALHPHWAENIDLWMERVTIFLSIIGLMFSFRLPEQLTRRHLDRLTRLIEERRLAEMSKAQPKSDGK